MVEEVEVLQMGPLTRDEQADLLRLADELRTRNIDASTWLRRLFVDPLPAKKPGRKSEPYQAERDARWLGFHRTVLDLMKVAQREAARTAKTPEAIQASLAKSRNPWARSLATVPQGSWPEAVVRHVAEYRAQSKWSRTPFETRAAMVASASADDETAFSRLRQVRARLDRKRTTK